LIDSATLWLYTIGAAALVLSPGPDFMYVVSRGMARGKKAGMVSALGISTGLIVHTILAVCGLSAIVMAYGAALIAIKYIGAAYLVYLGIKAIRNKSMLKPGGHINGSCNRAIYMQGVTTNVLNPKAILTFFAFIPQFINIEAGHVILQIVQLGGIIALLAALWFGIVGYFAGMFGFWLSTKELFARSLRYVSGSILIALGIRLVISDSK